MIAADEMIGRIYETLLEMPGELPQLLCDLADFCGAETASFVIDDRSTGWGQAATPRSDPDRMKDYLNGWCRQDPVFAKAVMMPVGAVGGMSQSELEEFRSSPLYHEVWKKSGLGAQRRFSNLLQDEGLLANFAVFANPADDVLHGETDAAYQLVLPHLRRASRLLQKQRALEMTCLSAPLRQDPQLCGLFFMTGGARVLYADEGAEELLRQESAWLGLRAGYLTFGAAGAGERLAGAVAAISSGCRDAGPQPLPEDERAGIELRSRVDGRPLYFDVVPCPKGLQASLLDPLHGEHFRAVVCVRDPRKGRRELTALLQEQCRLTHAEALLVLEMMQGDGREAAARRCGIALNTARAHLRSVFAKMGVTRQAELVARIRDLRSHNG